MWPQLSLPPRPECCWQSILGSGTTALDGPSGQSAADKTQLVGMAGAVLCGFASAQSPGQCLQMTMTRESPRPEQNPASPLPPQGLLRTVVAGEIQDLPQPPASTCKAGFYWLPGVGTPL